jgi:hypothetical protein
LSKRQHQAKLGGMRRMWSLTLCHDGHCQQRRENKRLQDGDKHNNAPPPVATFCLRPFDQFSYMRCIHNYTHFRIAAKIPSPPAALVKSPMSIDGVFKSTVPYVGQAAPTIMMMTPSTHSPTVRWHPTWLERSAEIGAWNLASTHCPRAASAFRVSRVAPYFAISPMRALSSRPGGMEMEHASTVQLIWRSVQCKVSGSCQPGCQLRRAGRAQPMELITYSCQYWSLHNSLYSTSTGVPFGFGRIQDRT